MRGGKLSSEFLQDDDLIRFESQGTPPLPLSKVDGYLTRSGAEIWYAVYGEGPPVVLLHGGLGHSGNWGYQVPFLVEKGYQVIIIDSRGHGRSTRDERPFSYQLMADDLAAVLDSLLLPKVAIVGWSDGAVVGLTLAMQAPERVDRLFFFACNVDPSGVFPFDDGNPVIGRCFSRHVADYAALSATPDQFQAFAAAVNQMQETEPDYTAEQLARIDVPVTVVQAEKDEFIRPEHASYLAQTLPQGRLVKLQAVSHFGPLQRPDYFNSIIFDFLHL